MTDTLVRGTSPAVLQCEGQALMLCARDTGPTQASRLQAVVLPPAGMLSYWTGDLLNTSWLADTLSTCCC